MNLIKKNWDKLIFVVYFVFLPFYLLYASGSCKDGTICNPLSSGINSIPDFIRVALEGLLKAGIPIVALGIIYCGFLFVFARGSSEKLTKAKDALLYTLIGAAILLGSWAIATMISNTVTGLGS